MSKYCASCGNLNDDNAGFCSSCGASMDIVKPPVEKSTKSKIRKFILIAAIIMTVLILITVSLLIILVKVNKTENKIISALKSKNYKEAIALYSDNYSQNDNKKDLIASLQSRLDQLVEDFNEEKIQYTTAINELTAIRTMQIDDLWIKLSDVESQIESLNDSKSNYKYAEQMMEKEDYSSALVSYSKVSTNDKNYDDASKKLAEATDQFRKAVLASAKSYADQKMYDEAKTVINSAISYIPNDNELTIQYNLYDSEQKDYIKTTAIENAEKYALENDYESAISELKNAIQIIDGDTDLSLKVSAYETERKNLIKSEALKLAKEYAENKDFEKAISTLDTARVKIGDDTEISRYKTEYQAEIIKSIKSEALAEAKKYKEDGDYESALSCLSSALLKANNDAEIKATHDAYEEEYVKNVISEADKLFMQKKYDEALACIKSVSISNKSLTEKYNEIKDAMPVKLYELPIVESSNYDYANGVFKDNYGNEYSERLYLTAYKSLGSSYPAYVIYALNGNYKTVELSFIALPETNNDINYTIQISVDDKIVKTVSDFKKTTGKTDVSIDVNNATTIKIYAENTSKYSYSHICGVNAIVYK